MGARVWVRALFGLVVAIASPLTAHGGWSVVGQIGGPVSAIAVQSSIAYVGVGFRVHVYDISDPASVREVASTPAFGDFISDIAIAGSRAYLTAGKSGLHILDISNPADPRTIGTWDSPGSAEGIAVSGGIAFLADGPFGLQIVDVSDAASPRWLSSAFDTYFTFDAVTRGPLVYVAAAGAGVLAVDASDTARPREMSIVDTPGYARGLAVANNTLYVADEWGGVRILDLAEPGRPRETGAIPVRSWAFAVALSGSALFVAAGSEGLQVFDAADPADPRKLSTSDAPWNLSWKIALDGDRAFLGVRTQGVAIFDVHAPSSPQRLGAISPLTNAQVVAARANLGFVATESQGMRIVDFSDVHRPRERGRGSTEDYGSALVVDDRHAYACEGFTLTNYLRVFDTSNPDLPVLLASPEITEGFCRDLMVRGTTLYMPDEFGLEIWDVARPNEPVLLGNLRTSDEGDGGESIDLIGSTAFVVSQHDVSTIDVSDSRAPRLLGNWSAEFLIFDAAADDHFAYAVSQFPFPSLYVLEARDPSRLELLGVTPIPGPGARVIVRDGKAYVAAGPAGVAVIDVTNPAAPVQTERIALPGFAKELTFAGELLLVASADAGLLILEQSTTSPVATEAAGRLVEAPHSRVRMPSRSASRSPRVATPDRERLAVGPTRGASPSSRAVVVSSTADAGPATLREALMNLQPGDTITFDPAVFPPGSPVTIRPQSRLPTIDDGGVTIDASSAGVILDGSALAGFAPGLDIVSKGNTVKGLQILNFPSSGVYLHGSGGNVIGGDRSRGTGACGEGNLISGNGTGIDISTPNGNRIVGNLIGTDLSGRQPFGRQSLGVNIGPRPESGYETGPDQIGGTEPWEANVIAGNGTEVYLHDARGQAIIGNFLGTDPTGSMRVGSATSVNTSHAAGNLIQGNVMGGGVILIDPGSYCNLIADNWIGVSKDGVPFTDEPYTVDVGVAESFNAVAGNRAGHAINISNFRQNVAESVIIGNAIGGRPLPENPPGTQAGVRIEAAWRSFIGGATVAERNEVSGTTSGIEIGGAGIDRTFILGNSIHDTVDGIALGSAASSVVQCNVITNNVRGVTVSAPTNLLRRNSIHANAGAISIDAPAIPSPPVIVEVTLNSVRGTSCARCTVEIYSDTGTQGRWYEGTATAEPNGVFSFTAGSSFRGPNVSAMATNAAGSTSAFSIAVERPPVGPRRRAARR